MRIAHVVSYVSVDGSFGGPVAVARAQVQELARRGHDVELLAGWDGVAPFSIDGAAVKLFRVRRFASGLTGLGSPDLWRYVRQNAHSFDVLHVHVGRDLASMPSARAGLGRAKRLILQPHGMIMPDHRAITRLFDRFLTRGVFRAANAVLALTPTERTGLEALASPSKLHQIENGIAWDPNFKRPQSNSSPLVLFLARLHERKRVLDFAKAAMLLIEQGFDARFKIIGPDEGDLPHLEALLSNSPNLGARLTYGGPVPPGRGISEMAAADVYVLPSVGEVFPMSVLESMSVGTPVVITRQCGIADELERRGAAVVCEPGPIGVSAAIAQLLASDDRREQVSSAARKAIGEWLSVGAVVDRLEEVYK